jgi:hypothetical protein
MWVRLRDSKDLGASLKVLGRMPNLLEFFCEKVTKLLSLRGVNCGVYPTRRSDHQH